MRRYYPAQRLRILCRCYHTRRAPQANSAELTQLLAQHASTPPRPINLTQLLSYGRPITPDSVLSSVSYVLSEIPRRLATRVKSIENLPFIVGNNPYIASVHDAYRDSFLYLATHPPVTSLEENAEFARHESFQECSKYMSSKQITNFLDAALRNRISVRLIAEQHVSISRALTDPSTDPSRAGVIDMQCSPTRMLNMCSAFVSELCEASYGPSPILVIEGPTNATFANHLEYILTELLKNAFRATVESRQKHAWNGPLPPVVVTLSPPPSLASGPPFFSFRIRDQGGGISQSIMSKIFSYAFTTAGHDNMDDPDGPYNAMMIGGGAAVAGGDTSLFSEMSAKGLQAGLGTIAGLGYGLPLSRLYASYFGGSLDLMSLDGWGTDVFLKLRCLDEAGDSTI
ncbi:atypical/PDHK/BCKDK protein kinase [Fistulina hepatica ATCC 64428]|nr:atypical/PDHK/BCKDK protein kinase [Fistulina hepatica ATCC 64428]